MSLPKTEMNPETASVLPFLGSVYDLVTSTLKQGLDGLLVVLLSESMDTSKTYLVLFGDQRRFLGDDRATDDVVVMFACRISHRLIQTLLRLRVSQRAVEAGLECLAAFFRYDERLAAQDVQYTFRPGETGSTLHVRMLRAAFAKFFVEVGCPR